MFIDCLAQLKSLHLYGMATAWSELLTAAFMENAHNLILVGGTGTARPISPRRWASLPSIRASESASSTRWTW